MLEQLKVGSVEKKFTIQNVSIKFSYYDPDKKKVVNLQYKMFLLNYQK